MGIRLHPLFTVPAALGLMSLVPLMETRTLPRSAWARSAGLSAAAALIAAVIAGLLPSYSAHDPQRLNLLYVQDRSAAHWIAASSGTIPASRRCLPRSRVPRNSGSSL